ncbi:MAG: ABC transporter permease [Gammaproteobacteria bacterium]|nr:ABC transporter permease [Gammaproteobacteria bacterium]
MNYRGVYTLFNKEILRFYKVLLQTVVAPVITALLYLLVFSQVMASHTEVYAGVAYGAFLIPGLMMMTMIQNAFANSSSSLIQSKYTGNIVFILLPPLSYLEFYLAFLAASIVRAVVVGAGVWLMALFFVDLPLYSVGVVLAFTLISCATLGTAGIIAGIWADKFDHLSGLQNFVIMPLSFLSGVFYSIHSLPDFWQVASHFNPLFYMIDGFRYGFFGVSDVNPWISFAVVTLFFAGMAVTTVVILKRGYKLRN